MTTSTTAPKRQKQPANKRKTPKHSEREDLESDTQSDIHNEEDHNEDVHIEEVHNEEVQNEDVHNEDDTVCSEEHTLNPEVNPILNDSVPYPPPSPNITSIPITIAPCPPPISTQP